MHILKSLSSPVTIGNGPLETFDFSQYAASTYVIITDNNVASIAGTALQTRLAKAGLPVELIVFPAGEASKSLTKAEELLGLLAEKNIDRDALLIALGGGVVGDLVGFIASIYKRGIRYVQVPTTLVAQLDSSIGAKTAVNLHAGKNLAGTTYPPMAIVTDPSVLASLAEREVRGGLAEAIKYGAIWDASLFEFITDNIRSPGAAFYEDLVLKCAKIKIEITDKDPEEKEFRKILNFGHTVGHALEIASNHELSHGEAIAWGMLAEARISLMLNLLSIDDLRRLQELIKRLQPPKLPAFKSSDLIKLMKRDKKSKAGLLYFVLLSSIGSVRQENGTVAFPVDAEVVRKSLSELAGTR